MNSRIFLISILFSFLINSALAQIKFPRTEKLKRYAESNKHEAVLEELLKIQHMHGDSPYTYYRRGTYRNCPELYYFRFRAYLGIFFRDSTELHLTESMKDYAFLHRLSPGYITSVDPGLFKKFHDFLNTEAEHAMMLKQYLAAERYSHYLAEVFNDTIPAYKLIYLPWIENHDTLTHAKIDSFATLEPPFEIRSSQELSNYLTRGIISEEEKFRMIYEWVVKHISYDIVAYGTHNIHRNLQAPWVAIYRRMVVCDGYANLFLELCQLAGLKAEKVIGYAKGKIPMEKHAYNVIWMNEGWHLVDCTWGSGSNYNYFCIDPKELIKSHFPDDPKYQLLSPPLTYDEFLKLPF